MLKRKMKKIGLCFLIFSMGGSLYADKLEDQKKGIVFCETKRELVKGPYRSLEEIKKDYLKKAREYKRQQAAKEAKRLGAIENQFQKIFKDAGKIAVYKELIKRTGDSIRSDEFMIAAGILQKNKKVTDSKNAVNDFYSYVYGTQEGRDYWKKISGKKREKWHEERQKRLDDANRTGTNI